MDDKELIFVDMDGVLADFEEKVRRLSGCTADITTDEWDKAADKYSRRQGFFLDLKPIDGAIDAFRILSTKYNCHILSTSPWDNDFSCSEKKIWVKNNLGDLAYKKINLSHHKNLFTGRALIDDRTKNGADGFNGEHIHFGTEKFPNWETVVKYLM